MAIDWFTTSAQIVNFLILVWLLKKLLYRPIIGAMESREQGINTRLQQLESRMNEAEELKARYENHLNQLQIEKEEVLAKARQEAEAEKTEILKKLSETMQLKKANFEAEMLRQQQELGKAISEVIAGKSLMLSRRILSRLADQTLERRIIERFLQNLSELPKVEQESIYQVLQQDSPATVFTSFETDASSRQLIQSWFDSYTPGLRLNFEQRDFLVCGITLEAGGRSWEWNMDRYLTELGTELMHSPGKPA